MDISKKLEISLINWRSSLHINIFWPTDTGPIRIKGSGEEGMNYLWERSSRSLTISWTLALKCHSSQWRWLKDNFDFVSLLRNHCILLPLTIVPTSRSTAKQYLGHWQQLLSDYFQLGRSFTTTVLGKTFSRGITHCFWGHLFWKLFIKFQTVTVILGSLMAIKQRLPS